jgi:tetratricopeptide (TPR) repeat protein
LLDRAVTYAPPSSSAAASELGWRRLSAQLHGELGNSLLALDRVEEGFSALDSALDIREGLEKDFPTDTNVRAELIRSFDRVARAERDRGHVEAAIELLERATETGQKLAELDPASTRWDQTRFTAHRSLAALLLERGLVDAANEHIATVRQLANRASREGSTKRSQHRNAGALELEGEAWFRSGDLAKARESFEEAIKLRELLSAQDTGDSSNLDGLLANYQRAAAATSELHDFSAALSYAERAVTLSATLVTRSDASLVDSLNHVVARANLTGVLTQHGDPSDYYRASELLRDLAHDLEEAEKNSSSIARSRDIADMKTSLAAVRNALAAWGNSLPISPTPAE